MKRTLLKTPITYYGGKQNMLPYLLEKKPKAGTYNFYNEPFCGGAAFYFSQEPVELECINDTNKALITFYRVCKTDFEALLQKVGETLHSRSLHRDADVVYNHPHLFTDVDVAWSVWVLASQSFSAKLDGNWGYDKKENRTSKLLTNRIERFTKQIAARLRNTQIECADALYIIQNRDGENTFHYVDPPYIDSDCAHYDGYSSQDYENLLQVLSNVKGKFLLSSYPSELLMKYAKANKWHMWSIEQKVSVNAKSGYLKRKIEVLTANYPI